MRFLLLRAHYRATLDFLLYSWLNIERLSQRERFIAPLQSPVWVAELP